MRGHNAVLQRRRGNKDNLGIISKAYFVTHHLNRLIERSQHMFLLRNKKKYL